MAPQGDLMIARDSFARLRDLKDHVFERMLSENGIEFEAFDQLSMGMSEDWREAIAEGSTIVRLGRAIFSEDF